MSEIILPRRTFLLGLAGLVAAPAIVRFSSLMPVRVAPIQQKLQEWRIHPAQMVRDLFQVELYAWQEEALQAFVEHRRVARVPRDQILMKGYGVVGVLTSELVEQPKPLWPLARRISGD